MIDYFRENMSYFGLMSKVRRFPKNITPERIIYGEDKDQYYLYYEPQKILSDKAIVWIHGGGWNAGDPDFFDYVGQRFAMEGYRIISVGYRLSPKYKYPCQIEDVFNCFDHARKHLKDRDVSTDKIIVMGPSAGAHLSSILCYSGKDQERYNADMSGVIGYIGSGGPYSFRKDQTNTIKILQNMLFEKGYDRKTAEPVSLMSSSNIPMLLVQSRHDGLVEFECAVDLKKKADLLGIPCELYEVIDKKNTHSWYTAGMFLEKREENKGLDKILSWIEER